MPLWPFRRRKTREREENPAEPSVIAHGVSLEGYISTTGELQIAGTVRGNIQAQSCFVEGKGTVIGEISAEEVFVEGRVLGPIFGRRVHVHAGAHIEGDIISEAIAIETGAYVDGAVRRLEAASPEGGRRPAVPLLEQPYLDEDIDRPIRTIRPD